MPGDSSKDDLQSVTQQLSGMGIQEVGMEVGKEKEMNFNEERSRVGLEEEEEKEAKVDNTGLGAEATRGVVEGANMGNKQ